MANVVATRYPASVLRRARVRFFACLAVLAVTSVAIAQDDVAQALAREGDAAFASGSFEQALAKFRAALEKSQAHDLHYRLGKTYAKLDRPVEALDHLERFLAAGGTDAKLQRDARAEAQALVAKVGELTVRAKDGTTVSVDGREIGKTPLAAFRVAAGIREVALGSYEETVRVGGGGRVTVGPPPEALETTTPVLAVAPTTAAAPGPAGPVDAGPTDDGGAITGQWWFWTAVGVVAVGAAVGVLVATSGDDSAEPLADDGATLAPVRAEW